MSIRSFFPSALWVVCSLMGFQLDSFADEAMKANEIKPYSWTTDHMHIGVRW
jgi:hypothetical protein